MEEWKSYILHTTSYIDKNLHEIVKEYIEMKFLFDYQDIRIIDIWNDEFKKEKNTIEKFTEENLKRLCEGFINCKIDSIFFDIPLPDSLVKTMRKSFKESYEFLNKIYKKIYCEDYEKNFADKMLDPEIKALQKQKYENYILISELEHLDIKIFTYDLELELIYHITKKKYNKHFTFITQVFFV